MPTQDATAAAAPYTALAEFRYLIRTFLVFSEEAARAAGLPPQHHQLLLAIKGLPAEREPTLGVIAERLQLQHHSCVELASRAEKEGLVQRVQAKDDKRQKLVRITRRGERLLDKLSREHAAELSTKAPSLVHALTIVLEEAGADTAKEASSWTRKKAKDPARTPKK